MYDMASETVKPLLLNKALTLEAMSKFEAFPKLQVVISISLEEDVATPAIGFDADTIRFLAESDALIDINTYRRES
ncbi:MAG: hypothetical protein CME36_09360 [unclassified Hahellaceae]|nr:hypothetical protein [Hahellaceae bacterium]|tara:strand:- start:12690 stop:12917 length:228 start_codon:yes stop_codon:yes gene_type:complete